MGNTIVNSIESLKNKNIYLLINNKQDEQRTKRIIKKNGKRK